MDTVSDCHPTPSSENTMIECFIIDSSTLDLSDKEQHVPKERCDRIDALLFMKDKLNSYAAGLFMKALTEHYGGHIIYGKNGKPYISENPIFFNISHSGSFVVCAISDTEIGVDIESIDDHGIAGNDDISGEVMTDSELSVYRGIPKEGRNLAFGGLWTAKESIMKYLGTGLTLHPKELTVLSENGIADRYDDMRLVQMKGPEGFCITVCTKEDTSGLGLIPLSDASLISGNFIE